MPVGVEGDAADVERRVFSARMAGAGLGVAALLAGMGPAWAHGTRAGSIVIDHPYATPTPAGARNGAVYFRSIENRGRQADRLVGGRSSIAESVSIQRNLTEGDAIRTRESHALDLPAGVELKLRHGEGLHLMLVGLRRPLVGGDRFSLWLRFEHAGEHEVTVWVQAPRAMGARRD